MGGRILPPNMSPSETLDPGNTVPYMADRALQRPLRVQLLRWRLFWLSEWGQAKYMSLYKQRTLPPVIRESNVAMGATSEKCYSWCWGWRKGAASQRTWAAFRNWKRQSNGFFPLEPLEGCAALTTHWWDPCQATGLWDDKLCCVQPPSLW